jgi:hypothetical protein
LLQIAVFVAIALVGGVWGTILRQSSDVASFVQTLVVLALAAAACLLASGRRVALLVHWVGVLGSIGYLALAPSPVDTVLRLIWVAFLVGCGLLGMRRAVRERLV